MPHISSSPVSFGTSERSMIRLPVCAWPFPSQISATNPKISTSTAFEICTQLMVFQVAIGR